MRRTLLLPLAAASAAVLALSPTAGASSDAAADVFVPAAGSNPATVDPASVAGSYRLDSGGWAVPVRSAPPAWFTEDEREKTKGGKPQPAPAEAVGPDVPLSGYVGIRPGSQIVFPYGCTTNFVFGSPGSYSIGTAGHCVDKTGQAVTLLTIAPGAPPAPENLVLVEIGTVTKRVDNGVGADFALISIKPELQSWVFPTIPVVGGPCGVYTGDGLTDTTVPVKGHATADAGEQVFHYGHGLGIGTGGTPRTGHGLYWESKAFWWAGSVVFGDSGSAARVGTTGLGAAGDVTHLIVFDGKHLGATAAGTRATELQRIAGQPIVSSPYCI
ncbi:MAG: hypothetical protein ACLGIG_05410 [Actinomycetes bacterium]